MSEVVVAFQGELGAFSHHAARQYFGNEVAMLPCMRFDEIFRSVADVRASHAIVPIENSLHGSVLENYDHLLVNQLWIIGEVSLRISHQLITLPETDPAQIRRVYSHPVALNQCLGFFARHPEFERVPHYDTAGSVKDLTEQQWPHSAAIASATAAQIYGGRIIARDIEDDAENYTRFFVMAREKSPVDFAEGRWKTSIVFSTANEPGLLFKSLACFSLRDINLTKIESRPIRGKPWEYLFYLDVIGHEDEPKLQSALRNLNEFSTLVRVLGSYAPAPS